MIRCTYIDKGYFRHCGYTSSDAMSESAQIRGLTRLVSLSEPIVHGGYDEGHTPTLAETLADRHADQSPLEQTRVNMDYMTILKRERVSAQARKVFRLLSSVRGCGSINVIARTLKVSPARVCHIKSELAQALAKHGYGPALVSRRLRTSALPCTCSRWGVAVRRCGWDRSSRRAKRFAFRPGLSGASGIRASARAPRPLARPTFCSKAVPRACIL
ncbi:MAG: hypothetical protein K8S99_03595 [Planctomycetes bacterium]|nr:hypothetical protein [Planctomycetota bacterium]